MFSSDKLSFEIFPANSVYNDARSIIKIRADNMFCFCSLTWEIWEDECNIVSGHVIAFIPRYACEVASPQAASPKLAFRILRH